MSTETVKEHDSEKSTTPAKLTGKLGTFSIVFMVIAAAAPLAVVGGNVPLTIVSGNGPGAPVGFMIAMLVMLSFSVGFVTMTPFVKEPGAFYAYIRKTFGRRLGLPSAYLALVTYTAILVANFAFGGAVLNGYFNSNFGLSIPWWVFGFILVALVGYFGYRKIDLSAKVLSVILVLEVVIILILDLIIFATGGKEGITADPFSVANVFTGTISVAILFALTGFTGFESTAIYRDETQNPDRVIPRATYIAVFIIGIFYFLACWALVVAWGPSSVVDKVAADADGFLIASAAEYVGVLFADIVNILMVTSIFACVLSFHNIVSRYQYALARDGDFPKKLGEVHEKHKSPGVSSLVVTIISVLILLPFAMSNADPLVNVFGSLAGVGTIGMLILLFITSLSILVFFKNNQNLVTSKFKRSVAPVIAMILLLLCTSMALIYFTMITGLSTAISYTLASVPLLVLVIGFVVATNTADRRN